MLHTFDFGAFDSQRSFLSYICEGMDFERKQIASWSLSQRYLTAEFPFSKKKDDANICCSIHLVSFRG